MGTKAVLMMLSAEKARLPTADWLCNLLSCVTESQNSTKSINNDKMSHISTFCHC